MLTDRATRGWCDAHLMAFILGMCVVAWFSMPDIIAINPPVFHRGEVDIPRISGPQCVVMLGGIVSLLVFTGLVDVALGASRRALTIGLLVYTSSAVAALVTYGWLEGDAAGGRYRHAWAMAAWVYAKQSFVLVVLLAAWRQFSGWRDGGRQVFVSAAPRSDSASASPPAARD